MIIILTLIWVLTSIHPADRRDWILESSFVVLFIVILSFLYRTFAFSNTSYLLITVFFILHVIGAHYAYQDTPVDDLFKHIFNTKRGFYDRIVHFAFGLLIAYPIREAIVRIMELKKYWLYVVTFITILASISLFEIIEMWVALMISPQLAAKYLGLQGDPLDTQKDMFMALVGVLLAIGLMTFFSYLRNRKKAS
ncbi:MAG TPA: DUF2238 domain-containing protein [Bacilli bacterium]